MLIPDGFQCLVVVQRNALCEFGCIRSLWVAPCEFGCTPCLLNRAVSTWLHRVNSLSPRTGVYVLGTPLFGCIEGSGCIRVQTIFFADGTSRGGKMQHYHIRNGLLYATTRGGEDCLSIPKGHGVNGETLRELMISEIHNKEHHSADRNLRYASEYIYCPEMRKDFSDFVRQCNQCQANKERNTLPDGDAQTLPFPSEIFSSYAIDFIGPFTKLKGQDSVLVVVDRAVGFSWLIPTSVTAMAVQTTELLRYHIFTPHGVPTSIVSDADPRFTSKFWKPTLKTMGIEHIMASLGDHQTNGQAERKIRELKTALRNVVNLRQTNWLTSLPEVA